MNILIGKLGRSCYWKFDNHSIANGDEAAPILYNHLANLHPEHNFYLIGRSDITRFRDSNSSGFGFAKPKHFPPKNIIDLFDDYKTTTSEFKGSTDGGAPYLHLKKKIANLGLKFDFGIFLTGPNSQIQSANAIKKVNTPSEYGSTLEMIINYSEPIVRTMNDMMDVPYFFINEDPRYSPLMGRDFINHPKIVLSQNNKTFMRKTIRGYYELSADAESILNKQEYIYAAPETIFLTQEQKVDFRSLRKSKKFLMGLNGNDERFKIVEDWLLKKSPDVMIYGKWDAEQIAKYPNNFKEVKINDVANEFWNTRYTLIPPFSKADSDFVTQKFWRMIYFGIIPFFHPQYDTAKIFNVPSILRPKTPDEMWKTIEMLDSNREEFKKVQNHIYELLEDKYFNGNHVRDMINLGIQKCQLPESYNL